MEIGNWKMPEFPKYSLKPRGKKGIYHYCLYYPPYNRHRSSTGTNIKEDAEAYTEKIIRQTIRSIAADGFNAVKAKASEVFDRYKTKKGNKAQATKDNYELLSRRFFEYFGEEGSKQEKTLSSISRDEVENWRDWLLRQEVKIKGRKDADGNQQTLSVKTVKEHLEFLSGVYRFFELDNPCARVERPKATEVEFQEKLKSGLQKCYQLLEFFH